MTDYTKLDGPDLLNEMGQDASKWADAFCQLNPDARVDEGNMIGWFANAIMHTLDTERGTIINGEHAEYLIEKGIAPNQDKITEGRIQGAGWAWAEACAQLDAGENPRQYDCAKLIERVQKDLS